MYFKFIQTKFSKFSFISPMQDTTATPDVPPQLVGIKGEQISQCFGRLGGKASS